MGTYRPTLVVVPTEPITLALERAVADIIREDERNDTAG